MKSRVEVECIARRHVSSIDVMEKDFKRLLYVSCVPLTRRTDVTANIVNQNSMNFVNAFLITNIIFAVTGLKLQLKVFFLHAEVNASRTIFRQ